MEMRVVETALGAVPVWSRGVRGGPLVVVIRGAFADEHDMEWLTVPGAEMAFLHLPGFFSPPLVSTSIGAFATAFREALAAAFPDRPYGLIGVSTGALVSMAMPATAILAIEPFLTTGGLWPMQIYFRLKFGDRASPEADWAEAIFGFRSAPRDYRAALDALRAPTTVLLGDQPLGTERRVPQMPSLCSAEDRAVFARHPAVTLQVVPGGHNLMTQHELVTEAAVAAFSRADELAR